MLKVQQMRGIFIRNTAALFAFNQIREVLSKVRFKLFSLHFLLNSMKLNFAFKKQVELPPSMWDEVDRLQSFVESNELVRHYLYPEKRAPRIYSEEYNDDWLECLMKITDVGDAVPVVGSPEADTLCESLWGTKGS